MSPTDLRKLLTDLPWDKYSVAELNQISVIMVQSITTARNRRTEIRQAEMQQSMANRPPTIPILTREQVYPPNSRAD